MSRLKCLLASAACLAASLPAAGQEGGDTPEMRAALAAGYKAAFTCSATFNAGQSMAEIEANELSGIYPDYRDAFEAVSDPAINDQARTVSVSYRRSMPPRIAAYRPGLGCVQLPIGASPEAIDYLPGFTGWDGPDGPDDASVIGDDVRMTFPVHVTDALEAPVSFAFDGQTYGEGTRTSAVVIARDGEIVGERYARGIDAQTPQRTWSVAKSIAATLIGAAANDGLIGPDSRALIEAWQGGADPRRNISLANLLHMASGLDSGERGARTDRIYFGGARVIDEALTAPLEAAPGTRFKYANNDTLAAVRALREALDDDETYRIYPYEKVLWPIGARRTVLETDWNGDFIASSQVWTTARDLARIGELYLNDGKWGEEQILHPDWREFVMTPAPAQPDGEFGYGAQFWLLPDAPGVPEDAFAAMGHRGQYLVIIPSEGLVIVRRGYDESGGTRFDITGFTRDIVARIHTARAAQAAEQAAASAAERELSDEP
ncbi:MAG: serine hydrolase [Alphaproteobacteria bacterium]|jgi:CubicO group peptidase (beta-lactamase class C family)|nr:serine hydrolase [Alphaproteobacteria bacterium]